MGLIDMEDYINEFYKKLEEKIKKTNDYYEFLRYVTSLDDFKEVFTFNEKVDFNLAYKAIENLDILRYVCNDENGIKKEEEFHKFLVNAVTGDNPVNNIINVHLLEIKYGNPERIKLDDYTPNDKLFAILESVCGLNSLVLFTADSKALYKRFGVLGLDEDSYFDFFKAIYELYEYSKTYSDEEFSKVLENYTPELKPFILKGLLQQLNEISNTEHGSFDHYNDLYKMITSDVLKISDGKKM